jgi:hypothetical protein
VVVTLGTSHRRTQPHGADRSHAIGSVLGQVFLFLKPTFSRYPVQAIEGRSHFLFGRCSWEQISSELFARELVEPLVGAERIQHVVPVGPHRVGIVAMEARCIGVANCVEPVQRLLFRVAR